MEPDVAQWPELLIRGTSPPVITNQPLSRDRQTDRQIHSESQDRILLLLAALHAHSASHISTEDYIVQSLTGIVYHDTT